MANCNLSTTRIIKYHDIICSLLHIIFQVFLCGQNDSSIPLKPNWNKSRSFPSINGARQPNRNALCWPQKENLAHSFHAITHFHAGLWMGTTALVCPCASKPHDFSELSVLDDGKLSLCYISENKENPILPTQRPNPGYLTSADNSNHNTKHHYIYSI